MSKLCEQSHNKFFTIDPISNPIKWFWGVAEFQKGNMPKAESL